MIHRSRFWPVVIFIGAGVVSGGEPVLATVSNQPPAVSIGKLDGGRLKPQQKPFLRLAKGGGGKRQGADRQQKQKMNGDGIVALIGSCSECDGVDGFVPPREIDDKIRRMVGKYKGGGGSRNVEIQQSRGVIETGLYPEFIGGADCPEIDSEKWAIDYSYKRGKAALHKGIDIPQPQGTAILAVADGVVVGRFENDGNKKGIEVMLRHRPDQTGLTFWTYSQYTHLQEMSPLAIGTTVTMGEAIGKTSNTGKMGKRIRRDALHFAVFYSVRPEWSNDGGVVTPKDGYFMDPNAFYRQQPPYDSPSMLALPQNQKNVPVAYKKADGGIFPAGAKRIWPYACK